VKTGFTVNTAFILKGTLNNKDNHRLRTLNALLCHQVSTKKGETTYVAIDNSNVPFDLKPQLAIRLAIGGGGEPP